MMRRFSPGSHVEAPSAAESTITTCSRGSSRRARAAAHTTQQGSGCSHRCGVQCQAGMARGARPPSVVQRYASHVRVLLPSPHTSSPAQQSCSECPTHMSVHALLPLRTPAIQCSSPPPGTTAPRTLNSSPCTSPTSASSASVQMWPSLHVMASPASRSQSPSASPLPTTTSCCPSAVTYGIWMRIATSALCCCATQGKGQGCGLGAAGQTSSARAASGQCKEAPACQLNTAASCPLRLLTTATAMHAMPAPRVRCPPQILAYAAARRGAVPPAA